MCRRLGPTASGSASAAVRAVAMGTWRAGHEMFDMVILPTMSTLHGRPSAVLLAVEDLEALDVLSDPEAMSGLAQARVAAPTACW